MQFLSNSSPHVLDDLLRLTRFRSDVLFHGELSDGWSLDTSDTGRVAFHLVCAGQCWMHMRSHDRPVLLDAGSVAILPRDAHHILSRDCRRPLFGARGRPGLMGQGHAASGVMLLSGYIDIDQLSRRLLFSALPDTVLIQPRDTAREHIGVLMELMRNEAATGAAGRQAALNRLADALFLCVFRYVAVRERASSGAASAIDDPRLARLLRALMCNPEMDWPLDAMAKYANMSRTSLLMRFTSVLKVTPAAFLAEWRMHIARDWLEAGEMSTLAISVRAGYATEAGFAKAFKRVEGVGPGQYRRRFRAASR